jgi:hypothetical protein
LYTGWIGMVTWKRKASSKERPKQLPIQPTRNHVTKKSLWAAGRSADAKQPRPARNHCFFYQQAGAGACKLDSEAAATIL